jgi:hypothetical protein
VKKCDQNILETLELVEVMVKLANTGDIEREDSGCGVLYGVMLDSAFKIKKLAEAERDKHVRKGRFK